MNKIVFAILIIALQQCLCEDGYVQGGEDLGSLSDKLFTRTTRQTDQPTDLDSLIDSVFKPPGPTENIPQQPDTQTQTNSGDANQVSPGPITGPNGCVCVPYYLCSSNKSVITDGVGLIDIRSAFFSEPTTPTYRQCTCSMLNNTLIIKDGPCDNYLDVCCDSAPRDPTEPITPKPIHRRTGCGHRNFEGVGFRITGATDNEAQFGEFPWMVAVLRTEPVADGTTLNVYQCGGSLIHPKVVMTAAHCIVGKDAREIKVRAGEWDTQTKNELFPHQDRDVERIIIHEQYYAGALYNDMALLVLRTQFELADNVDVVCLPDLYENFDNRNCVASGWGKDVFGKEGKYQVILKKVELPIVPRGPCLNALRGTRLGQHFKLHESFICAGGQPGKDTCKGDGGSPLVCPSLDNPSVYRQAGIVAWGIDCGKATPGVYVNVALLRNWINQQLAALNL